MNRNILNGKWKQLRGEVKRRWGQLTDDELDQANGDYDILAGRIQERYGYARDRAERDLDAFLADYGDEADAVGR